MHRILMICGLIVLAAVGFGQAQTATHAATTGATRHHGAARLQAAHKTGHGHKHIRTGLRRPRAAANRHHARTHRAVHAAHAV